MTRYAGIEFATAAFLLALGIGLLIPRQGIGLYALIRSGGYAWLWSLCLVSSSLLTMGLSFYERPSTRLIAVSCSMACWGALAFRFVEASLWGATLQSIIAFVLLNGCFFRLLGQLRVTR